MASESLPCPQHSPVSGAGAQERRRDSAGDGPMSLSRPSRLRPNRPSPGTSGTFLGPTANSLKYLRPGMSRARMRRAARHQPEGVRAKT